MPKIGNWCGLRQCRGVVLLCLLIACLPGTSSSRAEPATQPGEIPAQFVPRVDTFDYEAREALIPMRDGVKLKTLILIPNGAHDAPILLTRTPYAASSRIARHASAHLAAVIDDSDVAGDAVLSGGYIRVLQDVRGKHGSEGSYVMNRPLRGPLNPTEVDHATDAWDTIDWLVKNTPESNGKVGILGISYDGFTALMALVNPHPALRAVVPINAMVDGWMGDDWFHHGAFRQDTLVYAYRQEASRAGNNTWWSDHYDDYETWLAAGSAGAMARLHGLDQIGFVAKLLAHPAYDGFWQEQALDRVLARAPLTVPVLLVHSLWDQEDIYGTIAVYKALKPLDHDASKVFLVIGPWFHHQQRLDGSSLGPLEFGSDTARYFREQLLVPFLDHFLKDPGPPLQLAAVNAFETGSNRWLALSDWPRGCASGCPPEPVRAYLQDGGSLVFGPPKASRPGYTSYVSDPAKPVPYSPRPIHKEDADVAEGRKMWQTWMVGDQRDIASRPDVLSFVSGPLAQGTKVSGEPIANLVASTTGSDLDFIVKLIDVYPDEMGRRAALGGYQLIIAADILRGRYRNSWSTPAPIARDHKETYRFALPTTNHVFLAGHRIMIQVQSSWFPLYDRNPQTYIDNIFFARPGDFQAATVRLYDSGSDASYVELPLIRPVPGT